MAASPEQQEIISTNETTVDTPYHAPEPVSHQTDSASADIYTAIDKARTTKKDVFLADGTPFMLRSMNAVHRHIGNSLANSIPIGLVFDATVNYAIDKRVHIDRFVFSAAAGINAGYHAFLAKAQHKIGRPKFHTEHDRSNFYYFNDTTTDNAVAVAVRPHEPPLTPRQQAELVLETNQLLGGKDITVIMPAVLKSSIAPLAEVQAHPTIDLLRRITNKQAVVSRADYAIQITQEQLSEAAKAAAAVLELTNSHEAQLAQLLQSIRTEYPSSSVAVAIDRFTQGQIPAYDLAHKLAAMLNMQFMRDSEPVVLREKGFDDDGNFMADKTNEQLVHRYVCSAKVPYIITAIDHRHVESSTSLESFLGQDIKTVTQQSPLQTRLLASLQLLHGQNDTTESHEATDPHDEMAILERAEKAVSPPLRFTPNIAPSLYRRNRIRTSAIKIGYVALGMATILTVNKLQLGTHEAPDPFPIGYGNENLAENTMKIGSAAQRDTLDWRLQSFGMDTGGYYLSRIYNEYINGEWYRSDLLPHETVNNSAVELDDADPRIHVSGKVKADARDKLLALPIKEGTMVANATITDAHTGMSEPARLLKTFNGLISIELDHPGEYSIGYDLLPAVNNGVTAKTKLRIHNLKDVPLAWHTITDSASPLTAQSLADDMRLRFTYKFADKAFDKNQDSYRYANTIYNKRIANCNVAATVIAMAMHRYNNINAITDAKLEMASGYINTGNSLSTGNSAEFLEGIERHAFLIDGNGKIIDGTPTILDPSVKPANKPFTPRDLDTIGITAPKKFITDQHKAAAAVAVLTVAGAGGGYALRRNMRRQQAEVLSILDDASRSLPVIDLLDWLQYSVNPEQDKFTLRDKRYYQGEAKSIEEIFMSLKNKPILKAYLKNPGKYENNQIDAAQRTLAQLIIKTALRAKLL